MQTWVCNNSKDAEWDSSRATMGAIGCEPAVGMWALRLPWCPSSANSEEPHTMKS